MGVVFGKNSHKFQQRKSLNLAANLSENENLAALKNYGLRHLQKTDQVRKNESGYNIFASSNQTTLLSEKPSHKRSLSLNKFEKPYFTPFQKVPDLKKTAFEVIFINWSKNLSD